MPWQRCHIKPVKKMYKVILSNNLYFLVNIETNLVKGTFENSNDLDGYIKKNKLKIKQNK